MGHGAPSVVVQTLRDITEEGTPTDGGVPGGGVHAELLEMRQVDDDRAVLATDTEVGIAVATTAWLNLEPLVRGAIHNCCDLISAPGAGNGGGGDPEGCIIWLYVGELVE